MARNKKVEADSAAPPITCFLAKFVATHLADYVDRV